MLVVSKLSMSYVRIILVTMMSASQMYAHPGYAVKAQSYTVETPDVHVGQAVQESSADKVKKAAGLALKVGYNAGKACMAGRCMYVLMDKGGVKDLESLKIFGFALPAIGFLGESIYDDCSLSKQKTVQKSSTIKKIIKTAGNMCALTLLVGSTGQSFTEKKYPKVPFFVIGTIAIIENIYKLWKSESAAPEVGTEGA